MTNYDSELGNYAQNASGFFAGVLVGALLGALLGAGSMLLFAPQSGKRTRAKIQNKSIELLDQTNEAMEDMMDQAGKRARATKATVRKQAKELEQSGKGVFDEQKKRLATLVEAGKTAVQRS